MDAQGDSSKILLQSNTCPSHNRGAALYKFALATELHTLSELRMIRGLLWQ